jgi:hypothetical protein
MIEIANLELIMLIRLGAWYRTILFPFNIATGLLI